MTNAMRLALATILCAVPCVTPAQTQRISPRIGDDGQITYRSASGSRTAVPVGLRCSDLWVAPDESVIAFIADPNSRAGTPVRSDVPLERNEVFVAFQSDGFAPINVTPAKPIVINGRPWQIFRQPRVLPDLRTVLFTVPYTLTTSKLISEPVQGIPVVRGDESEYCAVWGGDSSGGLLTQQRHIAADSSGGVAYRCYFLRFPGEAGALAGDCENFQEFARRWSSARGGRCL